MNPSSLWWRAILALALMIGFYAIALAIASGCFVSAWALLHTGRVPVKLLAFLVIGGCIVVWSIVPRIDRFEPPSPRLLPGDHPCLFEMLCEVAKKTGQPMPHEVFLVGNVNAFVSNRGGVMGFGSRPVMGLGRPLLQTLTLPELASVVGHEFGHYVGGDTRLGPWVYKKRGAIARSIANLVQAKSVLVHPFVWYVRMFLRVTQAVSRHREYQADAVAARVTSEVDTGHALRKVHAIAPAYDAYWRNEVVPILEKGRRPPIGSGFSRFLGVPAVAHAVSEAMTSPPVSQANPYDTHPPLSERLRALGQLDAIQAPEGDDPAIGLLGDVPGAERALIGLMLKPGVSLEELAWEDVGRDIFPPFRAKILEEQPEIAAVSPLEVPELLRQPSSLVARLNNVSEIPTERHAAAANFFVRAVLGHGMVVAGWDVRSLPGSPIEFIREEQTVSLDSLAESARASDTQEWVARLAELGVIGTMG